jgi:hypothetical protein
VDALLSRGGQPPYEFGSQRGVRVSLGRRGDDVLYFCGIPVVQLRDYVKKNLVFSLLTPSKKNYSPE